MKVILTTNVPNVGQKYEVKNVASGFAMNFLFRNKLAELATPAKIKEIEVLKAKQVDQMKVKADLLGKNMDSLKGAKATIAKKANNKGHLFEGIHTNEIVEALKKDAHIDIEESMIVLEQPIKTVGEFTIGVRIGDKSGEFTLVVDPLEK